MFYPLIKFDFTRMNWLDIRRFQQVVKYGWNDAAKISKQTGKLRVMAFNDIITCYCKHHVFSNQYVSNALWLLPEDEKESVAIRVGNENKVRDHWVEENYKNWKFIKKWTKMKWESSPRRQEKRRKAYTKEFNAGKRLVVQFDVHIHREHYLDGSIKIGDNVLLAKHVFIDYSGELIIHDDVALANGVIIETHTHPIEKRGAAPQPGRLEIERGVKVLTGSYIADTCHFIGRYARIGAGTYIRGNVLPYAIMIGNPAKIVGFMYSPEEVEEFEKNVFPENERTDVEKYRQDYKKYYIDRRREIKSFLQK